jgi:hypothetical protein
MLNRGKKSVALDLKNPDQRDKRPGRKCRHHRRAVPAGCYATTRPRL